VELGFLLTSLIVVVSPGTGVLYTIATGLSSGPRASVVAAFGCTLGIVPHMAAAIAGLAALLYASALAFDTFKYVGAAYLLYLGWKTLRDRDGFHLSEVPRTRSSRQVILSAIAVNVLNPKLSIFFFAFLPQFVDAGAPDRIGRMLVLSGVFMLMTFVVFVGYGLFAAAIRRHLIARPQILAWMRRCFAAAFVALGLRLALAER
jgi:threonine/homoserine/homoserine lactone efflux protein